MWTPRILLVSSLVLGSAVSTPPMSAGPAAAAASTSTVANPATVVAGSTKVLCSVTGHGKSHSKVDLIAADRGYTFAYHGKTWWVFGDTMPTDKTVRPKFINGYDNDSMATSAPTKPGQCPVLHFPTSGSPVTGAYASPSVVPDPWPPGTPTSTPNPALKPSQVSLKTGESGVAGLEVAGKTYVVFETDSPPDAVPPLPPPCHVGCTESPTRSVVGVLENAKTLQFKGLYSLSVPTVKGQALHRYGDGAKFVDVAMEFSNDGYVYLWGLPGGSLRKLGEPYLARLKPANIATGAGITYFAGYSAAGLPQFVAGESHATQLFTDSPGCAGEIGASWNPYLSVWMMLYDCGDVSPGHPAGIYLRTAANPWGPWSTPQTVFDPRPWTMPAKPNQPDASTKMGFCYFIHAPNANVCPAGAPNPPTKGKRSGAYYGPYFVNAMMTGTPASLGVPARSTIYYTLDTDEPYGQVILATTLQGPTIVKPPPPCVATPCL